MFWIGLGIGCILGGIISLIVTSACAASKIKD